MFKRVRDSAFGKMDTRLYTPLCAVLAVIFFIVAVSQYAPPQLTKIAIEAMVGPFGILQLRNNLCVYLS